MKLDDGLWSAAEDSRIFRAIFNKTWLIGSLLALSACAEGVPPFGTLDASGSGASGSSGTGGTSGMGGTGGEVVPCDVMMCPDPPPPFPFVPAPAACCKDNGQCGAVDLFGGCA